MSSIQLSDELLDQIQKILIEHDAANEDIGISVQYLAAVIGYLVSQFPVPGQRREEILQHLFGLAQHVIQENAADPAPQGQTGQEAFGIWKPE